MELLGLPSNPLFPDLLGRVTSMIGHRELPISENLSNQAQRLT